MSPKDEFTLLYRGSRDGLTAECDGHSNTLTIIKATNSSNIFGGFASVGWESFLYGSYKSNPDAFLFSLINKNNHPLKMNVKPDSIKKAIYCLSEFGPSFGQDLRIQFERDEEDHDSTSNLGFCFVFAREIQPALGGTFDFLSGSNYFKVEEIEVYYLISSA